MPWAVSSSLSDNEVFFGTKHNIYASFMILFGLYDLMLLYACQICHVNCETENQNKQNLFKENNKCIIQNYLLASCKLFKQN